MRFTALPHSFEILGPPGGLGEVLLEARRILETPWKPHKFSARLESAQGFVRVRNASWDQACEFAARLTCVHDVRLALLDAPIGGWNELERELERLPWAELLPAEESFELHAEAGQGVCAHAGKLKRIAELVLGAQGFRPGLGDRSSRVDLMTHGRTLRVRLSLGGDALHKRGWRAQASSLATLREDVACAALVRLAEFEPRAHAATRLCVPFAGSGTLGLESWHALSGLPPAVWGRERSWQRLLLPSQATRHWWQNRVVRAAREVRLPPLTLIERDARQAEELRLNLERARELLERNGVPVPALDVLEADAFSVSAHRMVPLGEVTLMPLHPPYGLRLGRSSDTQALFERLGHSVAVWGASALGSGGALIGFCLCPSEPLWRAFQSRLGEARVSTSHITQGGLDVRVCAFSFG